jgi:catechol 2,3-dioxygenase-like lactoylglutathione lyase family enzyme
MQINEEIKLEEKLEDITGVTCIYIPVRNVYKSVHWYQKNLGCEPTDNNPVEPGMEISLMRLPDYPGKPDGPTGGVPTIFLMTAVQEAGSLGFTFDSGDRQPIACFTTPRIQEMYNRFKENGVNIVTEIPENRPCGPNFRFCDPDGNLLEIWQP